MSGTLRAIRPIAHFLARQHVRALFSFKATTLVAAPQGQRQRQPSTSSNLITLRQPRSPRHITTMSGINTEPATGAIIAKPLPSIPATLAEQKPEKPARISKRIRAVVHLLVTGECATITAASERAGLAFDYVRQELKKPAVRVFIERRARETIAAGMMRASARLNQLVDAGSEHVSLDATKHVLALAGIKPTADAQVSVNIDIKAGYVIDLSDAPARGSNTQSTLIEAQAIDNTHDGV